MNIFTKIPAMLLPALVLAVVFASTGAQAHGPADEEKVVPLQMQKLPDAPGKQVAMAVVSYEPGQASAPHFHSGSVFAYVLEGEVVSQLEGQPAVTYRAGESWYEPPRAAHLMSRNASNTRPAKLLAWLLMDEGGQIKQPLPRQAP
ncbi:cupin domain-containing protein [Polaromonas sp.]|uniref:cupin domain-containing protein n=1 Tax=Polaromonas sp. TaxID=1869339 RepID=UPI0025CDD977|nr:cupin domain-containing protein [Polaromonas sp.]